MTTLLSERYLLFKFTLPNKFLLSKFCPNNAQTVLISDIWVLNNHKDKLI